MRNLLFCLVLICSKYSLFAQNCSINAGLSTSICLSDSMKLYGTRSGLYSPHSLNRWTQVSGPIVSIVQPDSLITYVTGYTSGIYIFKLNNVCQDGIVSEDRVTIEVLPLTIADAGKDTILCPGNSYKLNGNKPLLPDEIGLWTIVSNGVGITINSPSNPNSALTLSPSFPGITKLRWTITNSNGCSSFDDVIITNCGGVSPVNAGPDQTLDACYAVTTCTRLVATNGGIGLGNQIGTWSFVSGPNMPIINPISNATTTVCNLIAGKYTFRYTVSGPCANGIDDVIVTVPPPNLSIPKVNAGSNITICDGISTITLSGNTPTNVGETVEWVQTSGPIKVNIYTPYNPSTIVSGITKPGLYIFRYSITNTNTGCGASGEVRCMLYETGTLDAGPDQVLPCNTTQAIINPTTTGLGYISYRIINGPIGVFNYPTTPQTYNILKGLTKPGTYRVEVNYQFGPECPPINDFIDITISRTPTGANAGSSQSFACASTSTQLAGNNPMLTGLGIGKWSQISGPSTAVLVNPADYICNVSGTIPGSYTFRWTISGGNSCPNNHSDIIVIIPDSSITNANAGIDRTVCINSPIILEGNPIRVDENARWTAIPTDSVIFTPSNMISTPTVSGLKANTTYLFLYEISNSCGLTSVDTVKINTSTFSGASIADAGSDQCLSSETDIIQLNATKPIFGTGFWTQIEGKPSTIVNPSLHNTIVTNISSGTSKFVWTVKINDCINDTKDTVSITISGKTTIANAGPDITACSHSQILNGNIPEYGIGHWSQISGDGNAIIENSHTPITKVKNLTTGLYTFRWSISNGVCPISFDDMIMNISSPPSTADAGPDLNICGTDTSTIRLQAIPPINGTGQWVWVTRPYYSVPFQNTTDPNATIKGLPNGEHIFKWIVSGGPSCPKSTDDVIIRVSTPANAGQNKILCNSTSTELKGNIGSKGTWTQLTGPSATIIQTPIDNPIANVTGLLPGNSYSFRYTIPTINGCPTTYDDVSIENSAPTSVPTAGINDIYCNASSFTLNGSLPRSGEKGSWSILSGPNTTKFSPDAYTPNATLIDVIPGVYLLKWTVSNGICSNSDIKRVDNFTIPTTANAGIGDTLCAITKIQLQANTPINGVGNWTQISGPNTAIFDAPNNPHSYVTNLVPGTYRFLWTISSPACTPSSSEVEYTILQNLDVAFAGKDQSICATTSMLKANILSGSNKGKWSQVYGPNSANLSSYTNPSSNLSNLTIGNYRFEWKVYNERCFNTDTVDIIVNPAATVYAGEDFTICNKTSTIPLRGATTSNCTTNGVWTIISGSGSLSSYLGTDTSYNTIFNIDPNYSGNVQLRLTASDKCNVVTDDVSIFITAPSNFIEAENDTTRTDPNTLINIDVLKNDKIAEGNSLKLCSNSINIKPTHGTAIINNDGTISYKPAIGYLGIDSFNYNICNKINSEDMLKLGCYIEGKNNAWVFITIEGCTIPNSFSPDGDGVNDFFKIPCAVGTIQLNIFNRWGIEVYRSDEYKNDWDGTYNGSPLPDGTYFYLLKYSTDNYNKLNKNGFITLRR